MKKNLFEISNLDSITIESRDINQLFKPISAEAVAVGCPHCSPEELRNIAVLLLGKKVKIPFYIFAAKGVIDANKEIVESIEKSGARVFADTCMVVSPIMERYRSIMVNSGKALAYVPDMCGADTQIGTIKQCVAVATSS